MSTLSQWSSSATWYDENMGEEGDPLNKNIIRPVVLDVLGNLANKSILDAGCGSGYLTAELAKRAKRVVGTDFSPEFVKLCQRKYVSLPNIEFSVQDLTKKFEFEDNSFDIILCKMVLQYVPEVDTFSKEANRLLKKNGRFTVVVDHPFHTQFFYAQELAGKKNPKYEGLEDYFSHTPKTKLSLWGKVELTWYPRMIKDYIQPFASEGLRLIRIEELPEAKESVNLPRILLLQFEK